MIIDFEPNERLKEILREWEKNLQRRMNQVRFDYTEDTIIATKQGDFIYVMANPVIPGQAVMVDNTTIARRNLMYVFDDPDREGAYRSTPKMWYEDGKLKMEQGRLLPVLCPWLLVRLDLDGRLNSDGNNLPRQDGLESLGVL